MNAPNEEAKKTALQLRHLLFDALEAAIENKWETVCTNCEDAAILASRCSDIERSYRAFGEEETE